MLQTLKSYLVKHPLAEKYLLCPTFAAGNLLVKRLTKELGGVVNLRPMTVWALCDEFATPILHDKRLEALPAGFGQLLVQELLAESTYFREAAEMPGLNAALLHTIQECRLAGLTPAELRQDGLCPAEKFREVADMLETWETLLHKHSFLDYPGMLALACQGEKSGHGQGLLLVPAALALPTQEQAFLASLTHWQRVDLPANLEPPALAPRSWRQQFAQPQHPVGSAVPALAASEKLGAFVATDPRTELYEHVRRLRSLAHRFEEVEFALANTEEQVPVLTALLETHKIPYTMAFSRSIGDFRVGRLARALATWIEEDYPAHRLLAMLEQGDFQVFPPRRGKNSVGRRRTGSPGASGGRQGFPAGPDRPHRGGSRRLFHHRLQDRTSGDLSTRRRARRGRKDPDGHLCPGRGGIAEDTQMPANQKELDIWARIDRDIRSVNELGSAATPLSLWGALKWWPKNISLNKEDARADESARKEASSLVADIAAQYREFATAYRKSLYGPLMPHLLEVRTLAEQERRARGVANFLDLLIDAINDRQVLCYYPENLLRKVEPFAYGINAKGKEILRGYQVAGRQFTGTQPDYRLGDNDLTEVFAQI